MSTIKRFGSSQGAKKGSSKLKNFRKSKFYQAYWQLPVALVIVVVLFFLVKAMLNQLTGNYLVWYWLNIWSLLLSAAILSGATAAIKDENKVSATAITWFLIVIFALVMVRDYSRSDHKVKKVATVSSTIYRLPLGESIFILKAGESTPWLGFPEGIVTDYHISSTSNNYLLLFSDGSRYGANIDLPRKEHPYFHLVAKADQTVTIKVTEAVVAASTP